VNARLRRCGAQPITDIVDGFEDGIALATILDSCYPGADLTSKVWRHPGGINRSQKLENIDKCFQVIKEQGIATAGLAPRDFVGKNQKFVEAFTWRLMSRVEHLGNIREDAKNLPCNIVEWLNQQVGDQVKITGPDSFKDGKALTALLRSRRPHAINMPGIGLSNEQATQEAIDAFSREYGIAELVDAADLTDDVIDEGEVASITAYVRLIKAAFEQEQEDRQLGRSDSMRDVHYKDFGSMFPPDAQYEVVKPSGTNYYASPTLGNPAGGKGPQKGEVLKAVGPPIRGLDGEWFAKVETNPGIFLYVPIDECNEAVLRPYAPLPQGLDRTFEVLDKEAEFYYSPDVLDKANPKFVTPLKRTDEVLGRTVASTDGHHEFLQVAPSKFLLIKSGGKVGESGKELMRESRPLGYATYPHLEGEAAGLVAGGGAVGYGASTAGQPAAPPAPPPGGVPHMGQPQFQTGGGPQQGAAPPSQLQTGLLPGAAAGPPQSHYPPASGYPPPLGRVESSYPPQPPPTGYPPVEPVPPPAEWVEAAAPDGRRYWYNSATRETTWTDPTQPKPPPPPPAEQQGEWVEATAPDGRKYWWSRSNQQTTWTNPYAAAPLQSGMVSYGGDDDWVEAIDNMTGRRYWFHKYSKKTTWEDPHLNGGYAPGMGAPIQSGMPPIQSGMPYGGGMDGGVMPGAFSQYGGPAGGGYGHCHY